MPSGTPNSPRFVVLGVSGGVAAYKAVELLRELRGYGYHVAPVLTPDATRFVGEVTFSALASEPARTRLYGDPTTPIPHTYLGQHADLIVVAPTTAHLLARLAMGLADDLLSATVLASRAPVLLCPAMHTEMWEQPSVQANVATLRSRGVLILDPDDGELAGGDSGAGRLPDPAVIASLCRDVLDGFHGDLTGEHVVVTAGGTREALDDVRYLGNRSSGRQGLALAEVACRRGARVTLINASRRRPSLSVARQITVVEVESASQMADAVAAAMEERSILLMAAAVSDFTTEKRPGKIKKDQGIPRIELEPARDILLEVLGRRQPAQTIVGFAAEYGDLDTRAKEKLRRKPVDLLVANDVSQPERGFATDTNEVLLCDESGATETVSLRSKEAIAEAIFDRVVQMRAERSR